MSYLTRFPTDCPALIQTQDGPIAFTAGKLGILAGAAAINNCQINHLLYCRSGEEAELDEGLGAHFGLN
jgi:hypothetical protein